MPPNSDEGNFEKYKMCREEGKHEFDVLAGRLNTFITSQAFLVSAFAVSMNNTNDQWGHAYRLTFPSVLSLVGLSLAVRATPGIFAACTTIRHWHQMQDAILADDSNVQKYYGLDPIVQTKIHARDIWFARTSPYIFGAAWLVFGSLALFLGLFRS